MTVQIQPVVYRIWDASGRLIYVGATSNLDQRLSSHSGRAWWFPLVDRIGTEPHPSMDAAFAAETAAIHAESPAFNARGRGGLHQDFNRLTPDDMRVCRRWVFANPRRDRTGALPVSLRWVVRKSVAA